MKLEEAIAREFGDFAPSGILGPVNSRDLDGHPQGVDIETIVSVLVDDSASVVRNVFASSLVRWDADSAAEWADGTAPNSPERRVRVYEKLGIPAGHDEITVRYPIIGGPVVIAAPQPWAPWYEEKRRQERDFYWRAYSNVVATKLDSATVDRLDVMTREIVQRLADPTRDEPYQSKGLVVGYVQSGKTANFAGVIAKSIDAGYRLIIVLTGTIEMLRSQTQRRLDMELIGRQNIGADGDYALDQDWIDGKFLEHEVDPNTSSKAPAIRRLTGASDDFKSLGKGLSALQYEIADHSKPLHDPVNLYSSNVRIAIVKKNSTVLKKLVEDLQRVPTELDQIPALIIDDEADQASVNTTNPAKWASDQIERTAINERIADLLKVLKRAQYIGYTATPFANVFVDVEDSETIFPKDFIISLDRPGPYMGGTDFHDLNDGDEFDDGERTPANSNKAAFVRDLWAGWDGEGRDAEQQLALDSFVLAGAIKLFRESKGSKKFRHHTMLVHESVKTTEHTAVANEFKALWKTSGYSQPASAVRLEQLWERDFKVVSEARSEPGSVNPQTFDELEEFIGAASDKIAEGASPVIIVNGEKQDDYTQEALNFDARDVWKILVGGAKLSRGFTVEGLTTTYYTRRTPQADTLMQMGRWFGFRQGYRDLVRLFIGRNVPGPAGKPYDMYEAFATIVRDEEEFRTELARFSGLNVGGEPMVTPIDVPPMVFQSQPWLKPTSANKMYNAEQVYRGVGGHAFSFTMQPPRGDGTYNKQHFAAVAPLLESLKDRATFEMTGSHGIRRTFEARYGVVGAATVVDAVKQFVWDGNWDFGPHLAAMESAVEREKLEDFAILLPLPKTRLPIAVKGWDELLPIVNRKRLDYEYRSGFSGTAVREREAIEHIAGGPGKDGGQAARKLRRGTRGGLILVFANDPAYGSKNMKRARTGTADPGDFATLFSYALPYLAEPTPRIGFRLRQPGVQAIVDAK
ncbi:Z1 domain-containing protein [Rhodococcoides kyotonense]|uniref:Z1 domain-containing protein n=1 Tax=Rhodococcoides kyotonense TaxID=398843 RepID=A0A239IYX6_9NOCA|nr:Z1 domain-containing protein [Rhodococcus kyotonensis]SNS98193.1 Z1 domain-containing protein [Rhodococcus kyotonensis]